jgi:hypothetical protein
MTSFTKNQRNCRKLLTCLTQFTQIGVTAENAYISEKTSQITGVTVENCLPA